MKVDLKAIRNRIKLLEKMYCNLAKTQEKDGSWDWWIPSEIDALEQELAIAQLNKISELGDEGNVIRPLVSSWQ